MSLGETRKLLQQSRKIVDEVDDNTNISVLLNTILKLVSSIDVRLQGVEKRVGKFDEIKTTSTSTSTALVTAFILLKILSLLHCALLFTIKIYD